MKNHHSHHTCPHVISFYGDIWRDWSMSPLFLLVLMNSGKESLLHWIMIPETCYSVFVKSLTTDLTYAMSQAVHILNTYEINLRINLWCSTPKLFNFIELDKVIFKINAFKIMSNFSRHPIYIYIYIIFLKGKIFRGCIYLYMNNMPKFKIWVFFNHLQGNVNMWYNVSLEKIIFIRK